MAEFTEMAVPSPRKEAQLEGGGSTDYPWYSPKFWHGMGAATWLGLLMENRVAVSPTRLRIFLTVSVLCGFNSIGRLLTDWLFRRQISSMDLPDDPIFIIGHWRSGTTLLHELMMLDERLTTPNTYQCFAPGHFLLTEAFFHQFGGWLLPDRRPIDNVKVGWDRPQEDEFALMNLGASSPYRRIAFPLCSPVTPLALDLSKLKQDDLRRWKRALRSFMIRLRIRDKRRPVLKSPTHTARTKVLLDMFPQAKFICITRNPYDIFPSTRRLWQSLHYTQSLQAKPDMRLDTYILNCFREMHDAFRRDRPYIPERQICEIRYEDLVEDPIQCIKSVYAKLDLGDFAPMEQALRKQNKASKPYRTNTYNLTKELRDLIAHEWSDYFEKNGYQIISDPTPLNR